MPVANYNRTITQVSIEQAAIGQTDFFAATPGARVYIVAIVLTLSAAGTLQFNEGAGPAALTGVIPVAANGGFVITQGGQDEPILSSNTQGAKVGLVTTGVGATAHGWIRFFIDS
jgi:hypothetical protein